MLKEIEKYNSFLQRALFLKEKAEKSITKQSKYMEKFKESQKELGRIKTTGGFYDSEGNSYNIFNGDVITKTSKELVLHPDIQQKIKEIERYCEDLQRNCGLQLSLCYDEGTKVEEIKEEQDNIIKEGRLVLDRINNTFSSKEKALKTKYTLKTGEDEHGFYVDMQKVIPSEKDLDNLEVEANPTVLEYKGTLGGGKGVNFIKKITSHIVLTQYKSEECIVGLETTDGYTCIIFGIVSDGILYANLLDVNLRVVSRLIMKQAKQGYEGYKVGMSGNVYDTFIPYKWQSSKKINRFV